MVELLVVFSSNWILFLSKECDEVDAEGKLVNESDRQMGVMIESIKDPFRPFLAL